jgi:hypothetical protein
LAAQREQASAMAVFWFTDHFLYIYILASKVDLFNQVSFKSKFKQYQCKRCLVQSGAGSRFFVAEKNCSTLNELLKKAGLSPQPDYFF